MDRPKQGHLICTGPDWSFKPGRKLTNQRPLIPLPNKFTELATSLITNRKLFRGWKNSQAVITAQVLCAKSNIIARHVSAKGLHVLEAPSLHKHHELSPHDKDIWDRSYLEEYNGLLNLDTWEVISEEEYKRLLPFSGKALLPTMAISTIKRDGEGNPIHAKYCILVALGTSGFTEYFNGNFFPFFSFFISMFVNL